MGPILHVCRKPLEASGSYNRKLARFIRWDNTFENIVVSAGPGTPSQTQRFASSPDLSPTQRLVATLAPPLSRKLNHYTSDGSVTFEAGVRRAIHDLVPSVVVCYDDYKLAPRVKGMAKRDLPVIFSQHGHRYRDAAAVNVYRLAYIDRIITLTVGSVAAAKDAWGHVEPPVHVIPNGVDASDYCPASVEEQAALKQSAGLPTDRMLVTFIGRMVPKKGAHILLEAWREVIGEFPDAVLWLIGGAQDWYHERLAEAAAQFPTGTVRVDGFLGEEQVRTALRASDVYALPTLWDEGHPRSVLEAMACGLPVVAGAAPGIVEHHGDGSVVIVEQVNSPSVLASVLSDLLADGSRRKELGGLARAQVESKFEEKEMFSRFRDVVWSELASGESTSA